MQVHQQLMWSIIHLSILLSTREMNQTCTCWQDRLVRPDFRNEWLLTDTPKYADTRNAKKPSSTTKCLKWIELTVQLIGTQWQTSRGESGVYILLDLPIVTEVGVDSAKLYEVTRRANLHKVTHDAILYKVTFDQRSMFLSHHGLLLLVNFDLQLGFYIPPILSLTYFYFLINT